MHGDLAISFTVSANNLSATADHPVRDYTFFQWLPDGHRLAAKLVKQWINKPLNFRYFIQGSPSYRQPFI